MRRSCSSAVVTQMLPKPAGASEHLMRSSSAMSSVRGGTMTMGAPRKRLARAYLKPEYWAPAMGWPPTNVKSRPCAMGMHASHTSRFTPQQSMTRQSLARRSAFSRSHPMAAPGYTARSTTSQVATVVSSSVPSMVSTRAAPVTSSSRSNARVCQPAAW